MKILWIDPGKITGWAVIFVENKEIQLGETGQTKDMQLIELIDHIRTADILGYEGWRTRPDKAKNGHFNWQEVYPEKVIGAFLTLAKLHQKDTPVEQQATQRVAGYAWAGMNYKKGSRGHHWQDALAHAVYFAVKTLRASPLILQKPL